MFISKYAVLPKKALLKLFAAFQNSKNAAVNEIARKTFLNPAVQSPPAKIDRASFSHLTEKALGEPMGENTSLPGSVVMGKKDRFYEEALQALAGFYEEDLEFLHLAFSLPFYFSAKEKIEKIIHLIGLDDRDLQGTAFLEKLQKSYASYREKYAVAMFCLVQVFSDGEAFLESEDRRKISSFEKAVGIKKWIAIHPEILSIKSLDLSRMCLEVLPEEINWFKNLEKLDLAYNQLTHLPDLDLPNLETLVINHNLLKTWPGNTKLPALRYLHIFNNELEFFPENVQYLYWLNAANNRIKELPDNFFMPNLEHLNLVGNQIQNLPGNVDFSNIGYFNMIRNPLQSKPGDDHLPQEFYADLEG